MNFFRTVIGSFHSAALYREVRAKNSFMVGYALLIVMLTTLVVVIAGTVYVHNHVFKEQDGHVSPFEDVVNQIASQIPVMTLKDNTLTTNEPGPFIIKLNAQSLTGKSEEFSIAVIDTSGNAKYEEMTAPILVTNKDLIVKSQRKTEFHSLSELTKGDPSAIIINRAVAEDMAKQLITYIHDNLTTLYLFLGAIVWFTFIIYMFVARLLMLLILGLVGLVFGSLTKQKIDYEQSVGLASISYTPIAILDTLLFVAFSSLTHFLTLLAAGSVALFVAMKCSSTPNEPPPPTA